jgi:hypothetical protein
MARPEQKRLRSTRPAKRAAGGREYAKAIGQHQDRGEAELGDSAPQEVWFTKSVGALRLSHFPGGRPGPAELHPDPGQVIQPVSTVRRCLGGATSVGRAALEGTQSKGHPLPRCFT